MSELTHYGVKGMKWGKRKAENAGAAEVEFKQRTPGSRVKIKTSKGGGLAPSQDAVDVKLYRQAAKKSGSQALSNKELQAIVTRMNLEKQYAQLSPRDQRLIKKGAAYAKNLSSLGKASNEAVNYSNSPAGKLLREKFTKG